MSTLTPGPSPTCVGEGRNFPPVPPAPEASEARSSSPLPLAGEGPGVRVVDPSMNSRRRIVVGMSGGVDSSIAAWLLKRQGHDVVGLFMKNWEDDDDDEYCSSRQDWLDAASAADVIGIDLEAVNFAAEYRERVFAEFLREYSAGRTPNPDVLCNAEIKFKAFLDHALTLGAQRIATGHYARIRTVDGSHELLRAVDGTKDQSYFLHRLRQDQLARTLFPLGEMRKTEVRALARRIGLSNAAKRDSTGICFIGERPFRAFLARYLPTRPGPIRSADGRVLGEHVGLSFYTLGQRKGIGVGGMQDGTGEPWFVARKDLASNTLWVVQGHDHPWLLSDRVVATSPAWVGPTPRAGTRLSARTRYRQGDAGCTVRAADAQRLDLEFDQPQWAVTPGQSAVLYDGEVCLGGAIIESATAQRAPAAAHDPTHTSRADHPAVRPPAYATSPHR
jgi:tRNA-specific 2-thiouridylase